MERARARWRLHQDHASTAGRMVDDTPGLPRYHVNVMLETCGTLTGHSIFCSEPTRALLTQWMGFPRLVLVGNVGDRWTDPIIFRVGGTNRVLQLTVFSVMVG